MATETEHFFTQKLLIIMQFLGPWTIWCSCYHSNNLSTGFI